MLEFDVKSRVQLGRRREERPRQPLQRGVRSPATGHERRPRRNQLAPPYRPLGDDGHSGGSHREGCAEDPENRLHVEADLLHNYHGGGLGGHLHPFEV